MAPNSCTFKLEQLRNKKPISALTSLEIYFFTVSGRAPPELYNQSCYNYIETATTFVYTYSLALLTQLQRHHY